MGLYLGDMIYYIVLFLILMWLIKLVAWKPLTKVLDKRTKTVQNNLDSAKQANQKATELAKKRQEALDDSNNQASNIISNAKSAGQKQQDKIIALAQNEAKTLQQNAHQSIQQDRQDAVSGAKDDIAKLSIQIASKIIQERLDPNEQKSLIDSCIKGLKKNGK